MTIPSVVTTLNNLTLNNTTGLTLSSPLSVGGTLYLTAGTLTHGGNLTMGAGSTIAIAAGTLASAPALTSTVNVSYTGAGSQTAGAELPTSTTALVNLTIANGGGLTLGANATVNGVLTLGSHNLTTGANVLYMGSAATVSRTTGYIVGNEDFAIPSVPVSKTFDLGTANGYSPFTLNATTGAGDFLATVAQTAHSPAFSTNSLNRYWTLTDNGITQGDVSFQYQSGDVVGNESNYQLRDYHAGAWSTIPGSVVNTGTHTISATGVTSFSDFTAGECPTLTLNPGTLINANQGAPYSQQLSTTGGGQTPFTYAITSGNLPVGVTMTSGGLISGTPTVSGDSLFTVTVTDAAGCTAVQAYSLNVTGCPVFTITPATLPTGLGVGAVYVDTFKTTGGAGGYKYNITAGSLPAGLTLDTATGIVTGTTTTPGIYNFTLTVTDQNTCTSQQVYKVVVCGPIALSALPTTGTIGSAYSQTITVLSGGTPGYAYTLTGGALPTGLTMNAHGAITGTITANGIFGFTVTVTDTNGCQDNRVYADTISCPVITVSPATLPNGSKNASYAVKFTSAGGTTPYAYTQTAGALPAGLAVSHDSLVGKPTVNGIFTFTITSTDSFGCTGNQAYTLLISSPATFRVANTGISTMSWDSAGTWIIETGTSAYGWPKTRGDSVILDNKYHPGNYTIVGGVHTRDTCGQLTIGYPGNANQITLLVPTWADSSNRRLVIGDSLPANYDLVIAGGGLLDLEARWSGSYPIDLAGYHSPDSVRIRAGGRLYWASAGYQTIFFNLNRGLDGDYGTVELDVPHNFSDFNWGSSYVLPNFILSNNHNAPTYYPYGSGAGIIKGNFIINPGVVDSLDLGLSSAAVVYGNIVNNGQTVLNNSQLVMAGSNQTITGSVPLRLKAGIAVSDSLGVTSSINLNVEGGSVQTNGTITSGSVNLPAKGTLTMNGGTTMYLNPAGSMNEGTNPVSGTISATRTISTSGDPMGNIGFDVASAAVAPGVTTVVRQNGTALSGNGHSSIKRYYDVNPAIDNALGATVDFAYGPAELNGITETNLVLSKSTDGGTSWTGKAGSINTSLHKITATAVQSLSRWTAADVNAPLYITHTVVERKFADLDGNPATTGDQSPKKWKLYLYADSVTAGTLVGSGNPNSGVLTTANLASGTYIAVEEDSLAWLHLGLHQHGTSLTNTLKVNASRYDTISFTDASANSVDTIDFINQAVSNLTVRKFRSLSGNPASLDARKAWGLTVYKGSVAPGNIMATGNVDSLTAGGLQGGLYIASEADSGATWKRVNGNHGLNDTMTLVAGQAVVDTFVNFKPNTITVSGFTDADGFFLTAGDRTAHAWYFEVRQNDGSGALVSFGSGTTLTVPNLGDGTYYISEADSSNWIHLGNVVNATATPTNANNVSVSVANGQTTAVSFVNAPPVYSAKFRSFLPNLIPVDVDNKGKTGKYVVPGKPDKAQFVVGVNNITDSANGLHMEFADAIDTGFHLTTVPASVVSTTDSKLKKWDFTFSSNLANPESVYVYGYAWAKKATKVSGYYFKKNGTAVSKAKKDAVAICILREPMPNRINGLFEAFNYGGFNATGGLVVGVNKKAGVDSSKIYGWFQSLKYTDVLKSLDDKGTFHTQNGRPFDVFTGGKQITGQQKSLSPNKQNNRLLASMIALKLNITLSALGVTTPGFGELVYDSRSGDPLDGKMVKEIAAYIDTEMMGTVTAVTVNKKTTYTHHYDTLNMHFGHLDSIVASINGAFEGTVDTTRFFDSLRYAGTAELIAVPFLHADPSSIPARIIPMAPLASQDLPMAYTLYQNYPNPFNPTTTIQFDLPEASIVTLKVYNILGQEVATLLSRQQLSDGTQTVQFNAAKYASGVYFYRLNTEKLTNADDGTTSGRAFVSTKKMVLIK